MLLVVKNLPASGGDAGDASLISQSGRSPGVGNGNMLQYSCLENSRDRLFSWAIVHGVAKNQTRLNTHTHTHTHARMHARTHIPMGLPGSSAGKESTSSAGDPGSIPELGRSPGE